MNHDATVVADHDYLEELEDLYEPEYELALKAIPETVSIDLVQMNEL